ncbi:MAG: glycoside hydrolase family 127 protein, partial [Bryobacteraceae bacterium]
MKSTRREFLSAVTAACAAAARQEPAADWRDQGILHLERSPHARLRNVPVRAFAMGEGFWSARRKANVERSIPTLLQLLEEHGVVDNFRRLSGRKNVPRRGPLYTDSDLYKWMEAVAFVLQSGDHPGLCATFDRLAGEILAAQEPSGYLNTYYVEERRNLRFKEMHRGHELYCLGHLLQAGIAYYRATGNRTLLDGGIKFVNYLAENFGRNKDPLLTGHPCLEMALVELYRTTRDGRHLELAGYLLEGDGERLKLTASQLVYLFSGKPFTSRSKLEGHAVRAMYACCGAADYFMETGRADYARTLETLWQDLVRGKIYITGGVGSRAQGEAFGEPYELPNRLAYTESCAAIGNMMWNWRLLAARGEARFADVLERALYNGVNSGMS